MYMNVPINLLLNFIGYVTHTSKHTKQLDFANNLREKKDSYKNWDPYMGDIQDFLL